MGMQAESISYMPAFGFSIVTTTLVGQCIGSREPEMGKAYLGETIKGSILITSISVIFLVFFPRQVMSLLTNDAEVIRLGAYYLIIMGIVQIPQNLAGVFGGALRGAGFTKVPMTTAFAGLWGIRVPFTLVLTYVFKLGIVYIWIAMGVDLVFRLFLSYFLYKRKDIFSAKLVFDKSSSL
jgi:Na+-driven multidrug efflux pump